ncbi:glycosyltransferase family 2 protein [Salipiger sp. IMCC34102]|uniref:glycosyltransferase family 2 protein n=1 Tax=Salipiger sp. IMCC34102 TaxID=2510647 RepID=UPI00101C79C1|nr:glycosyltransferase family 2 protein [Salipiger sp. IMCC34102]RYH01175.1 glycosyltransferase family 2 protein [Salipiger sp. IMCC34102]
MSHFTIVIPCYNAATTLPETLASIEKQTHHGWTVICVDDGSTDDTVAIVRAMFEHNPRITLLRNRGKGPSDARNHGASHAGPGTVIAFCDADDIWSPTKLEELARAFADPSVDAAYGQIAFFRDTPTDAVTFSTVPQGPLTIPMLLAENPVCTMSNIAVRQDSFAKTGGFDPAIVHNEDLEWLIRLVGDGAMILGIDKCQTWYRTSAGGLSSDLEAMAAGRETALRTATRYGHAPDRAAEAIHQRYLARRSLRLGQRRTDALRYALRGLAFSPAAFFSTPRRGVLTLAAVCAALVMPRGLSAQLFSR